MTSPDYPANNRSILLFASVKMTKKSFLCCEVLQNVAMGGIAGYIVYVSFLKQVCVRRWSRDGRGECKEGVTPTFNVGKINEDRYGKS